MQSQVSAGKIPANAAATLPLRAQLDAPLTERQMAELHEAWLEHQVIGLLWPRMRWAGGILTVAAISAAILSHMTWLGFSVQGDQGLLFSMAIVTFTCGFTVLMLHRASIPNYVPMTQW